MSKEYFGEFVYAKGQLYSALNSTSTIMNITLRRDKKLLWFKTGVEQLEIECEYPDHMGTPAFPDTGTFVSVRVIGKLKSKKTLNKKFLALEKKNGVIAV